MGKAHIKTSYYYYLEYLIIILLLALKLLDYFCQNSNISNIKFYPPPHPPHPPKIDKSTEYLKKEAFHTWFSSPALRSHPLHSPRHRGPSGWWTSAAPGRSSRSPPSSCPWTQGAVSSAPRRIAWGCRAWRVAGASDPQSDGPEGVASSGSASQGPLHPRSMKAMYLNTV